MKISIFIKKLTPYSSTFVNFEQEEDKDNIFDNNEVELTQLLPFKPSKGHEFGFLGIQNLLSIYIDNKKYNN